MSDAERAMKRARAACTCLILVSSEVREREIDRERAPPPHVVCLRCEERERERDSKPQREAHSNEERIDVLANLLLDWPRVQMSVGKFEIVR